MTELQVSTGLFDWWKPRPHPTPAPVPPEEVHETLRATQMQLADVLAWLHAVEKVIATLAIVLRTLAPIVLPLVRTLLATQGLSIPAEWLLFLTTENAPMPRLGPKQVVGFMPAPDQPAGPPPGTMHPLAVPGVGADADHGIGAPLE